MKPYTDHVISFFMYLNVHFEKAEIIEKKIISRALGQGAFGEVYHGILKSKTDSSETNVAVKTLPELSTNQGK